MSKNPSCRGGGRPFIDVSAVKEITFELRFGDLVGSFSEKIDNHAYRASVVPPGLCAFAHAGPAGRDLRFTPTSSQGLHGFLIVVFHYTVLLSFSRFIGWGSNLERYDKKYGGLAT